jgi:hypothetical protein
MLTMSSAVSIIKNGAVFRKSSPPENLFQHHKMEVRREDKLGIGYGWFHGINNFYFEHQELAFIIGKKWRF